MSQSCSLIQISRHNQQAPSGSTSLVRTILSSRITYIKCHTKWIKITTSSSLKAWTVVDSRALLDSLTSSQLSNCIMIEIALKLGPWVETQVLDKLKVHRDTRQLCLREDPNRATEVTIWSHRVTPYLQLKETSSSQIKTSLTTTTKTPWLALSSSNHLSSCLRNNTSFKPVMTRLELPNQHLTSKSKA
jgi:hypothetical protein